MDKCFKSGRAGTCTTGILNLMLQDVGKVNQNPIILYPVLKALDLSSTVLEREQRIVTR